MAIPNREHFFDGVDPIDPQVIALSRRSVFRWLAQCPYAARCFSCLWRFLRLPQKYNVFNLYGASSAYVLKAPLYEKKSNYFTFQKTPYRIVHIADETRPALVDSNTGSLSGSITLSSDTTNKRIRLGIGLTEAVKPHLLDYTCRVDVSLAKGDTSLQQSFTFPVNGTDGLCHHRFGESWLDWFMDVPFDDQSDFVINLKAEFIKNGTPAKMKTNPGVAWSAPQILSRGKKRACHKIIYLSLESLSDPIFLARRFGLTLDIPSYKQLMEVSEVYALAYAQGDATLPAAGAFLTGLMPTQHGMVDYWAKPWNLGIKNPSPDIQMLAEILKEAGFYTKAGTSYPRYSPRYGWYRGFDSYKNHSYNNRRPMLCSRFAVNFLDETKNLDSFLFMHWDGLHNDFWVSEPQNCFTVQNTTGDKNILSEKALFQERLHYLDVELGIIMDYLKSSGLWDETMLIVTADHGWGYGTWEKKQDFALFEDRIRVPLVVKYPKGIRHVNEVQRPVNASIKPFPIILNALGIPFPRYYGSLPQQTMLNGLAVSETVMQPTPEDYAMAIMSSQYKYHFRATINWKEFNIGSVKYHKLFHTQEDGTPDESNDISGSHPGETEQFRDMASTILQKNLSFLRDHKPVDLLSLPV